MAGQDPAGPPLDPAGPGRTRPDPAGPGRGPIARAGPAVAARGSCRGARGWRGALGHPRLPGTLADLVPQAAGGRLAVAVSHLAAAESRACGPPKPGRS